MSFSSGATVPVWAGCLALIRDDNKGYIATAGGGKILCRLYYVLLARLADLVHCGEGGEAAAPLLPVPSGAGGFDDGGGAAAPLVTVASLAENAL